MNKETLERPFEAYLIKTRRGPSGKTFSYIEGAEYIRRLNEAFDGQWSFEVVEHMVRPREVVVLGKITAEGCVKSAFGGTAITMNGQTGEPMNLADDLKAAATDALKKAASLFGVGLHLHSPEAGRADEERDEAGPAARAPGARRTARSEAEGTAAAKPSEDGSQAARQPQKTAEPPGGAKPGATLTERQLNAIMAIGRTLGWTSEALRQRALDVYGVPPNELSRQDASAFIGELQQIATKSAA
jgi:hypothetical protein